MIIFMGFTLRSALTFTSHRTAATIKAQEAEASMWQSWVKSQEMEAEV